MTTIPFSLRILSIDETTITLKADTQTIILPRTAFFGVPVVGQTVKIIGVAPGTETTDQNALARALLNELLIPVAS